LCFQDIWTDGNMDKQGNFCYQKQKECLRGYKYEQNSTLNKNHFIKKDSYIIIFHDFSIFITHEKFT